MPSPQSMRTWYIALLRMAIMAGTWRLGQWFGNVEFAHICVLT